MNLPLEGSCLCDAVQTRIVREPLFTHACHCLNCQKRSGSAFTVSTNVLASDLEVAFGEATLHPRAKKGRPTPLICGACATILWVEITPGAHGLIVVPTGSLSNKLEIRPQAHIFVHRKQDWVVLEEGVPTFNGFYDLTTTWPASSLDRLAGRSPR